MYSSYIEFKTFGICCVSDMQLEIICTECGSSSIQVIYGRPVCLRCGVELDVEKVELRNRDWDRGTTVRNLNRIRRFGFILNRLSDRLGLTDEQVAEVRRFIANLVQLMGTRCKPSGHFLVTYSIWRVLRSEGIPISLNEILNLTNMLFNKNYKVRHVNRLIKRIYCIHVDIDPYIRVRAEDYIDYVINRLFLERPDIGYHEINEVRERARYVCKLLNRGYPISNPRVAAGVSISIAIASNKSIKQSGSIDRMIEYISELLRVSHYTLKRRVREAVREVGLIKKNFTI